MLTSANCPWYCCAAEADQVGVDDDDRMQGLMTRMVMVVVMVTVLLEMVTMFVVVMVTVLLMRVIDNAGGDGDEVYGDGGEGAVGKGN